MRSLAPRRGSYSDSVAEYYRSEEEEKSNERLAQGKTYETNEKLGRTTRNKNCDY